MNDRQIAYTNVTDDDWVMAEPPTLREALDALWTKLDDAADLGIYPERTPDGRVRTPYQDGWNAASIAISEAMEKAHDEYLRAALAAEPPAWPSGEAAVSRSFSRRLKQFLYDSLPEDADDEQYALMDRAHEAVLAALHADEAVR